MKHRLLALNEKSPCRLQKKGSQHHQTQMDTQTKWGNNHCLAPWNLTAVSPSFTQPNVFQRRNSLRNLRWPQDLAKYHSFEVAYESLSHHVLKPSLKCQECPEHGFVIFLKISFYFVFCHDGCIWFRRFLLQHVFCIIWKILDITSWYMCFEINLKYCCCGYLVLFCWLLHLIKKRSTNSSTFPALDVHLLAKVILRYLMKFLQLHLSFNLSWCLFDYVSLHLAIQHFCQYILLLLIFLMFFANGTD